MRLITGALTGHYSTNEQLAGMKLTIDTTCRACVDSVESMIHILCECDALARKRMSILVQAYTELEDYGCFPLGGIVAITRFAFEDDRD